MNTPTLRFTVKLGVTAAEPFVLHRTVDLPRRLSWSLGSASPLAVSDPALCSLAEVLAAQGFHVAGEAEPCVLPMPWAGCCAVDPSPPTATEQTLVAAALALGLLPVEGTADWDRYRRFLQGREDTLADDLREAIAFWLLTEGRFADDTPDTAYWTQDRRQVLVLRDVKLPRRHPAHPWLVRGYRLLKALVRLRDPDGLPTLDDLPGGLESWPADESMPLAFQQAFWWEAHYRLSETGRHAEADVALERYRTAADKLGDRLPGLAGREGLGLGVALGRQAYYQGHYDTALGHYLKEWERADEFRRPRLKRLLSGLLSDMFCLEQARQLALEAAQEEHKSLDSVEDYKSAGRWGEAELRYGNYPKARASYLLSLDLQEKRFGGTPQDGQTYTYLGHVNLLEGEWAKAAYYYRQAQATDRALNIYTLMGWIALAVRRQTSAPALELYERHREALEALASDPVKALPLGVIAGGLFLLAPDPHRALARAALERMIDANYAIEALYLMRILYKPKEAKTLAAKIQQRLGAWDSALKKLPAEWRGESSAYRPTPGALTAALAKALKSKDGSWTALDPYLSGIYPMNLLGQF